MFSKSFCVLPFHQSTISNAGQGRLCQHCYGGDFLSLYQTPFEQIWNSDHLRSIRSRMIEGIEVKECGPCYKTERDSGTSLRQRVNSYAQYAFEVSNDDQVIEKAVAIVRDHDGNAPPPSALNLWLGNHCNLKCRMCNPNFSSQIASDAVHSKWHGDLAPLETSSRMTGNPDWSKNENIIVTTQAEKNYCT